MLPLAVRKTPCQAPARPQPLVANNRSVCMYVLQARRARRASQQNRPMRHGPVHAMPFCEVMRCTGLQGHKPTHTTHHTGFVAPEASLDTRGSGHRMQDIRTTHKYGGSCHECNSSNQEAKVSRCKLTRRRKVGPYPHHAVLSAPIG